MFSILYPDYKERMEIISRRTLNWYNGKMNIPCHLELLPKE